jgi:hypothetical protein
MPELSRAGVPVLTRLVRRVFPLASLLEGRAAVSPRVT